MLLRYVLLGFGVAFFLMLSESNSKAQTSYNSSSPPTDVTGTITAAIQTASGNYLTAVGGGGLSSSNFGSTGVAVQTDAMTAGPSETLTVVWLNTSYTKFALRTLTGNYVTAVNGGGIGGPNDGSSPIHTDATSISGWETFRINFLPNNQVTINLPDGRFLTAVNGGGVSGTSTSPIQTNASQIGPTEIFTLVNLGTSTLQRDPSSLVTTETNTAPSQPTIAQLNSIPDSQQQPIATQPATPSLQPQPPVTPTPGAVDGLAAIVPLIYWIASTIFAYPFVRRKMMNWYRSQRKMFFGKNSVDIMNAQIGNRMSFEGQILIISALFGPIGGWLTIFFAARKNKTA